MADLVLGVATSHLAMVLRQPPEQDTDQMARFRAGFATRAEAIDRAGADTLIVVSAEHINKFFLDNLPAFAIGTAEAFDGPVEDIPIEKRTIKAARGLAWHVLGHGLDHGVDWARADEWSLDHGMMVPLHFLDPDGALPIVPVFVNCAAPPYPALDRCRAVGGALADAVRAWPEPARVAMVACGGLSHSPGDVRMGFVDEAFDRQFLDHLRVGDARAAASVSDERVEQAGSSTAEIRSWLMLAGAFAGQAMQVVTYEPIKGFGTGCAQGLIWPDAAKASPQARPDHD